MNAQEAKEFVMETCKSPMQLDLQAMARAGLYPAFRVVDFERLSDPDPAVLQEYLVWLECDYGITLAQHNFRVWLEHLEDWPWVGHWSFVVRYVIDKQPRAEWDFGIIRYLDGVTRLRRVEAKPKWAD